jgi:UDP-GlcNAc:undecaprenyl-phosphate/decaprenyl-phosphate GlcNAc-1-phosphate transferase
MTFLLAFAVAAVVAPLLGRPARALGLIDRPGDDGLKIHRGAVPLTGGVAVVAGALVATLLWGAVPGAAVAALVVALVAGLIDDRAPLPAWVRLPAQAGAGVLLAVGGIEVAPLGALAGAGTVVVVVLCANAVNIVDGQDGLAGGLAAIAALGLAGASALAGAIAGPSLALAGGLAGFLAWNFPRARVFLGDGGAYAAGTALAALSVVLSMGAGWSGLLAAGLCVGPFAFELAFTVLRRLGTRQVLMGGDRGHAYDLLAEGIGRTRSTVASWGIGAASAALGLVVVRLTPAAGAAVVAGAAAVAAVAGLVLWRHRALRRTYQDPYADGRMAAQTPERRVEP